MLRIRARLLLSFAVAGGLVSAATTTTTATAATACDALAPLGAISPYDGVHSHFVVTAASYQTGHGNTPVHIAVLGSDGSVRRSYGNFSGVSAVDLRRISASADGSIVSFGSDDTSYNPLIHVMDAATGTYRRFAAGVDAAISPDGTLIAYNAPPTNASSGPGALGYDSIWVADLGSGAKCDTGIRASYLAPKSWSRDGMSLYYAVQTGTDQYMSYQFNPRDLAAGSTQVAPGFAVTPSPDGQSALIVTLTPQVCSDTCTQSERIERMALDGSSRSLVFETAPAGARMSGLEWAPDGSHFIVTTAGAARPSTIVSADGSSHVSGPNTFPVGGAVWVNGDAPAPPPSVTPTVQINPSLVNFGQTAYVTISGTAGATVDLYARKYLGSFTKIRDGLILDSNGKAVVATRPDMNLRFQAKDRTVAEGSSLSGADGLMTVRKNVTINVRRVGTRRYTFSGSIAPLHPGATVSLFRNGSLVRSGIPVSSSRVYAVTLGLPGGTYTFQVRTGATGYNAASTSPAMSVGIY